jgi:UDPglucose 6-dehydrogenase/GDP-mannose 6-dehydrogenase
VRVAIVGAGYVGLVTGACLADVGHDVVVADVDGTRVERVNAGVSPIHEAGLAGVLAGVVGDKLRATTDVADAVSRSELTILAVGTPSTKDGIDLTAIVEATRTVGRALADGDEHHSVVVKSTVVPGTTDGVVAATLAEASGRNVGSDLGVGMNPEFLTEGRAVADFQSPDRLVLGANDARTHAVLQDLYSSVDRSVPRLLTNTRTAEMIKYASNALLATSISFANEIADICSAVGGVDVVDVMAGLHSSEYLSPIGTGGERVRAPIASFLEPGCGFGGSCLPKDLRALVAEAARRGADLQVLPAALRTNERRPDEIVRLVESAVGDLSGRRAAVLGIAFKPDTDDVRETPAAPIVTRLLERGASVLLHDPVVDAIPEALAGPGVELEGDLTAAIARADVVVLVTRWEQYLELPALLASLDAPPPLVDGRRMLEPGSVPVYAGIGRD